MDMIYLKRPDCTIPSEYAVDAVAITRALETKGYQVSPQDAYEAWKEHSDSYCASWLILPEGQDEILRSVLPYLKEY